MEYPRSNHHHQHHHCQENDDVSSWSQEEVPPNSYTAPDQELYPSRHNSYTGQPVYGEDPYRKPSPQQQYQTVQYSAYYESHQVTNPGGYGDGYGAAGYGTGGGRYSDQSYGHGGIGVNPLARRRTVRVFPKAAEGYSLAVRDGMVVLVRADSADESQHWIKDEKYATRVKDEEGFPSFALVNKATGHAIKHAVGAHEPIQLVPYKPDTLDLSVLWTESGDTGEGFRCIRMVNKIGLNFDAFHGDRDHGGVHEGTTVVLWEWLQGENQRWKIVPY